MPDVSFDCEWLEVKGVAGPELAATWASLRIVACGSVVTRVLDDGSGKVRESVFVPLYPLAEWLAMNWWFLSYEFESPAKRRDRAFRLRHCLSANREGYAFPDLEVVSSGARTSLKWKRYAPRWTRVEFLDEGQASIERLAFRRTCTELIDGVIQRLDSQGIEDTALHQEWAAIQATEADEEELRFCEIAAGLGLDPYDLDDSSRDDMLRLAGSGPRD